jgi:eukaryotic-like serine/threonine-protein kinase
VAAFLREVFTLSGPNLTKGEQVTARELLDEAARHVEERLGDQPAVRAALLSTIARVYGDYGVADQAAALYTRAIELRRTHEAQFAAEQADDLRSLALIVERETPARSDSMYTHALALAERYAGQDHPVVARLLTDYGHSLTFRKAVPDDSVWRMYARAVRILRRGGDEAREALAHALVVSAYGQPDDAVWFDGSKPIDRMRESLALRIAQFGETSLEVASSLSDLALAVEGTNSGESVELLRRAVAIMDKLVQKRHPLAFTLVNNLAAVHRERGELEVAEPLFREVLALYAAVDPSSSRRAYPLSHLGDVLNALGRPAEAEPYLRESLVEFARFDIGAGDIRIVTSRKRLITSLELQGKAREAARERALLPASQAP